MGKQKTEYIWLQTSSYRHQDYMNQLLSALKEDKDIQLRQVLHLSTGCTLVISIWFSLMVTSPHYQVNFGPSQKIGDWESEANIGDIFASLYRRIKGFSTRCLSNANANAFDALFWWSLLLHTPYLKNEDKISSRPLFIM